MRQVCPVLSIIFISILSIPSFADMDWVEYWAYLEAQRRRGTSTTPSTTTTSTTTSGDCGEVPEKIMEIAENMKRLKEECPALSNTGSGGTEKPIIVADLSDTDGKIYIFNSSGSDYSCTQSYDSNSWGNGGGAVSKSGPPKHCADDGSKITPAGLHLLTKHDGTEKWTVDNSFKMLGLESQGSEERGVLVHGGHQNASCSTHGCSGLADEDFDDLKENQNGLGAMWYNFFGDTAAAEGCEDDTGYSPDAEMPTCETVTENMNQHQELTTPSALEN